MSPPGSKRSRHGAWAEMLDVPSVAILPWASFGRLTPTPRRVRHRWATIRYPCHHQDAGGRAAAMRAAASFVARDHPRALEPCERGAGRSCRPHLITTRHSPRWLSRSCATAQHLWLERLMAYPIRPHWWGWPANDRGRPFVGASGTTGGALFGDAALVRMPVL
jgi:hypothetical protein